MAIGDLNLHFEDFPGNTSSGKVDRDAKELIEDPALGALTLARGHGPTHSSGSTLDYVAADFPLVVDILPRRAAKMESDHNAFLASIPAALGKVRADPTEMIGRSEWERDDFWEDAMQPVEPALRFLAGTAGALLRTAAVRVWLAAGAKRRLRQLILDWLVYWRTVVIVLAGHLAGAVRVSGPNSRPPPNSPQQVFGRIRGSVGVEEEESRTAEQLDTYLRLAERDAGAAEAFLSRCVKPRSEAWFSFI